VTEQAQKLFKVFLQPDPHVLFLLLVFGGLNADKNATFQRFLFIKQQSAIGNYALEIGCVFGHGVLPLVAEVGIGKTRLADVVLFNAAIPPPCKIQQAAL
jgi:hypothetical protein